MNSATLSDFFFGNLEKFWFDHNMVTTLDLPLPLNILEDIHSQQLKTSTSSQLKKIIQRRHLTFKKKNLKTLEATFTHQKIGHELCSSCKISAPGSTSKTSDFPSNIWKSMKMKIH